MGTASYGCETPGCFFPAVYHQQLLRFGTQTGDLRRRRSDTLADDFQKQPLWRSSPAHGQCHHGEQLLRRRYPEVLLSLLWPEQPQQPGRFAARVYRSRYRSTHRGGEKTALYSYAKNSVGFEGSYNFFRWLSAKWSYGYDRMHRHDRETFNADEYGVGPTFDIKPTPDLLFRLAYRHLWRNISAYNALPEADAANISRKFDEAARRRNKTSALRSIHAVG